MVNRRELANRTHNLLHADLIEPFSSPSLQGRPKPRDLNEIAGLLSGIYQIISGDRNNVNDSHRLLIGQNIFLPHDLEDALCMRSRPSIPYGIQTRRGYFPEGGQYSQDGNNPTHTLRVLESSVYSLDREDESIQDSLLRAARGIDEDLFDTLRESFALAGDPKREEIKRSFRERSKYLQEFPLARLNIQAQETYIDPNARRDDNPFVIRTIAQMRLDELVSGKWMLKVCGGSDWCRADQIEVDVSGKRFNILRHLSDNLFNDSGKKFSGNGRRK